VLHAGLERLLQVRRTIGLRNSGHTIAKMMLPVAGAPALRLMSHTHPEFGKLMAQFAEDQQAHVMLLRGTEGEAVADARRLPRLAVWLHGQPRPDLGQEPTEGTLATLPMLPRDIDAPSTARWIRTVLSGDAAVPPSIDMQVQCILRAVAGLAPASSAGAATPV
jgi:anthranilate phosphoribosyltransferase